MAMSGVEAKNTLDALLDRVERGEEIVITRHGKPESRRAAAVAVRAVKARCVEWGEEAKKKGTDCVALGGEGRGTGAGRVRVHAPACVHRIPGRSQATNTPD